MLIVGQHQSNILKIHSNSI